MVLEMSQPEDAELVEDYNITLIRIILEDKDFKERLEKALLANQEKLTFKKFELEGKLKRPTAANWLKDFIKRQGAEIFNNIELSRYITDAKNAKLLSEDERQLLKKLLLLYRNLKFFPESMKDKKVGDWEIVPVEKEEVLNKIKDERSEVKKEDEISGGKPNSELEELRKLAEQYAEGSLERRAIEEEIGEIRNKK